MNVQFSDTAVKRLNQEPAIAYQMNPGLGGCSKRMIQIKYLAM